MDENLLEQDTPTTNENYTAEIGQIDTTDLVENTNSDAIAIWGLVLTILFGIVSVVFGIISICNGRKIDKARKEVEAAKNETDRIKKQTEKNAANAIKEAKEIVKQNIENLNNTIYRSSLNKVADSVRKVVFPEVGVNEEEFSKNVNKAINEFFSEISKIHRDTVYSKVQNEVDSIIDMRDYFLDKGNFDEKKRNELENKVSDMLNIADDISRTIAISTKEEI